MAQYTVVRSGFEITMKEASLFLSGHIFPGYHIERSVFELNRTQSNVNRTIKFDSVRSSNEIELTKNKCKSNQIEHSIKSDDVRFS